MGKKTLEECTKKELIEYIQSIRPKADAYDRVCKSLGIEDNILGYINNKKKYYIGVICKDRSDFNTWADECGYGMNYYRQRNSINFQILNGDSIIDYTAICNASTLVGRRFSMLIETANAKENPDFEKIITYSKNTIHD